MLAISEIIIASAIFLGIVYWEVKFLYAKTNIQRNHFTQNRKIKNIENLNKI